MSSWPRDWRELPMAGIINIAGSSLDYKTGTWRARKPVLYPDKCIKCQICWLFCPDMAINRLEDDSVEINYEYCKGCGICAEECPTKAIEMVEEVG